MDFKRHLLYLAIATSSLSLIACGGESSNSNSNNRDNQPSIPMEPEPEPKRVFTAEEKLQLGKQYIADLDDRLTEISTGFGEFQKDILDATNELDGSISGSHRLKSGIQSISNYKYFLIDVVSAAKSELHKENPVIEVDKVFSLGDIDIFLRGTSQITVSEIESGYQFDISVQMLDESDGGITDSLNMVVSEQEMSVIPDVSGDPATHLYRIGVNGTLSNEQMSLTLENGISTVIYDGDPEVDAVAVVKEIKFEAERFKINIPAEDSSKDVSVEAAVSAIFSQPLLEGDDGYFYEDSEGSLGMLGTTAHCYGSPCPKYDLNEVTAGLSPFGKTQTESLNIEKIEFTNARVSVGEDNYIDTHKYSWVGGNAATFVRDTKNNYSGVTYEITGDEDNSLTLSSEFGSVNYEFIENENADVGGIINCTRISSSYAVSDYLTLNNRISSDCLENVSVEYDSLFEWLDALGNNNGQYLYLPKGIRGSSGWEEIINPIGRSSDRQGEVLIESYHAQADTFNNPIEYMNMAEGQLKFIDVEKIHYKEMHNHPSSKNYQHNLILWGNNSSVGFQFDELAPKMLINMQNKYEGELVETVVSISKERIVDVLNQYNGGEGVTAEQRSAIEKDGTVEVVVGEVKVEGSVVAIISILFGTLNSYDYQYLAGTIYSFSVKFIDGTYPEGEYFYTVDDFSKATVCLDDDGVVLNQSISACKGNLEDKVFPQSGLFDLSIYEGFNDFKFESVTPYNKHAMDSLLDDLLEIIYMERSDIDSL